MPRFGAVVLNMGVSGPQPHSTPVCRSLADMSVSASATAYDGRDAVRRDPREPVGSRTARRWDRAHSTELGVWDAIGTEARSGDAIAPSSVPVPNGATEMPDIGGSHGYFSVAICRRHPGLRATVLDLPSAIEHAAPLLDAEGMSDRVQLVAGDALADDLDAKAYDVVFLMSLVHHFDEAANRALAERSLAPCDAVA